MLVNNKYAFALSIDEIKCVWGGFMSKDVACNEAELGYFRNIPCFRSDEAREMGPRVIPRL